MKILIICFSQTGNTLKVAKSLRQGLNEVADSCDLVDFADFDIKKLSEYDLVGLGCPVFYYREPFNISEFINNLRDLQGQHWFVFCSHGSILGLTLISMTDKLEKRGAIVLGSHHTYADATFPSLPHPTITTGHPDSQDLQEAKEFGKTIARCSQALTSGDRNSITKPAPVTEVWVPEEAAMLTPEIMAQIMPRLSINRERCNDCGDCQDSCPVNGIDLETEPPRIQNPCIHCWYCAKICPTCAIEADWNMMVKMMKDQFPRLIQALKDAESRGEFRWLIDPETINLDDPLYKQRERNIQKDG
jgi:flavodoxin/ferredoxin